MPTYTTLIIDNILNYKQGKLFYSSSILRLCLSVQPRLSSLYLLLQLLLIKSNIFLSVIVRFLSFSAYPNDKKRNKRERVHAKKQVEQT